MTLRIDHGVASLCRIVEVRAFPVAVGPASSGLVAEMDALAAELADAYGGKAPSEIEGLQAARDLYKAFGIDPTRTRPSSEALLRRVLKGQPLPRVLNAVDVANLCSVRFLLPLGLYDAAKIRGEAVLRRGTVGEGYEGIRKDRVHVDGRPVLVDEEGPFGNPTSDSLRTCVDETTTSLWMVIFAPRGVPEERLRAHGAWAAEAMARHLAGAEPVRTEVSSVTRGEGGVGR
jgi:DNA/RNA-binding domain of Phe-tRNA-synthetase-like protein